MTAGSFPGEPGAHCSTSSTQHVSLRRHLWVFHRSWAQWGSSVGDAGNPHQQSVSYSAPKSSTRLCPLLCQVLLTHLKCHFCSKKPQLEVLTSLQTWETEAQGFLQLRTTTRSPPSDLSVPQ